MFRLFSVLVLLSLGACASVDAPGRVAVQSPFMSSGMAVDAPDGYLAMCQQQASLCGESANLTAAEDQIDHDGATLSQASWTHPAGAADGMDYDTSRSTVAAPATLTESMALLNRVNHFVNDNVRQRADQSVYGVAELWRRSGAGRGATGDCKDIAIEKRLELIDQGFPARDLFYAIGYRRDIGLHAVLIARTNVGDVVLDSRSPYIVAWSEAPYTWVKHQSRRDPSVWVLVNGPAADSPDIKMAALDISNHSPSVAGEAQ